MLASRVLVAAGLLVLAANGLEDGVELPGALVREWPVLYSHNAGTGYMTTSNVLVLSGADAIYNLASASQLLLLSQNHVGTFADQLNCGARGLNVRPQVHEGRLIMHHGFVGVDVLLSDALDDVVAWANANPSELVILGISQCDGADCDVDSDAVMTSKGFHIYDDCSSALSTLNVTDARLAGELSGGGSVIVFKDAEGCIEQNYDEGNLARCYPQYTPVFGRRRLRRLRKLQSQAANSCYLQSPGPYADLKEDLFEQTAGELNLPVMTHQNAHWQYTTADLEATFLLNSGIVGDSSRSEVNIFVQKLVEAGDLASINLLQVDNVCDGGPDLARAVAVYAAAQGFRVEPQEAAPSSGAVVRAFSVASLAAFAVCLLSSS